jgi:hypothetical protein
VRQQASLVARLAHHLPLASGLVLGKIAHTLPAVAAPRLLPSNEQNAAYARAQVTVNNVAWTITVSKRSDHIWVDLLHQRAGIPSVNQKLVKAVAMEAWLAFTSVDGGDGARNAVGCLALRRHGRPVQRWRASFQSPRGTRSSRTRPGYGTRART